MLQACRIFLTPALRVAIPPLQVENLAGRACGVEACLCLDCLPLSQGTALIVSQYSCNRVTRRISRTHAQVLSVLSSARTCRRSGVHLKHVVDRHKTDKLISIIAFLAELECLQPLTND